LLAGRQGDTLFNVREQHIHDNSINFAVMLLVIGQKYEDRTEVYNHVICSQNFYQTHNAMCHSAFLT
jgi:hypothetical protein